MIASDRNSSGDYFALGVCKLATGAIDETIWRRKRDPVVFNRYLVIGQVHLLQSRTDEAIVWFEKARGGNSQSPWPHVWLASAYSLKGETDRGVTELSEASRLLGDRAFTSIAAIRAYHPWAPNISGRFEATFLAGLHKAGVPEK